MSLSLSLSLSLNRFLLSALSLFCVFKSQPLRCWRCGAGQREGPKEEEEEDEERAAEVDQLQFSRPPLIQPSVRVVR